MSTNRSKWLLLIAISASLQSLAEAGGAASTNTVAPAAGPTAGQGLGTLFFSPAQRLELEKERKGKPTIGPDDAFEETGPVINGVATRSDGRLTVWVDGKPRWENANAGHVVKLSSADVGTSAALLRSNESPPSTQPATPARKPSTKRSAKLRTK